MRRRRKRIMKVGNVLVKSRSQLDGIRESGRINTAVLDYVEQHICAGISTAGIDRWVYDLTAEMGAVPAPLNFEGFPKSVCTSIDDVVCHGIPSPDVVLKDGDIINIDCSTNFKRIFFRLFPHVLYRKRVSGEEKAGGSNKGMHGTGP